MADTVRGDGPVVGLVVPAPGVPAPDILDDLRPARPSEAAHDPDSAPCAPLPSAAPVVDGLGAGERREHHVCPACGPHVAAVDGCCATCGADCAVDYCRCDGDRAAPAPAHIAVGCASCAEAARVIDGLLAVRGVTEAADEPRPHAEGYGCPECDQRRCEDAAIGAAFRWLDGRRAEVARWEATARQHLDAPSYRALSAVQVERRRQDAKWGEQNHEPVMWIAILTEEVGEAASAALHLRSGDPDACEDDLRAELVQVAAVAVAAIEALDRRRETP